MAGKVARANEKRKAGYKNHPARLARNTTRRQETHIHALEKKMRKFQRYVEAGKMSQEAFERAKLRMEKEIAYTRKEIPRGAVLYKQPKKQTIEE